MLVALDFCSDEFPIHFKGFSDMLATLHEKFPIYLYMKINHVCQQWQHRNNGIPISIYNHSFDAMDTFCRFFGVFDDTDTKLKVEYLVEQAGLYKNMKFANDLGTDVWIMDNNVNKEPKKKSMGKEIEMLLNKSRCHNAATSKKSNTETT